MCARLPWRGGGHFCKSLVAFLRAALIPFGGQEAVPMEMRGHPGDEALGNSNPTQVEAISPLPLQPLHGHGLQGWPKAPGVAQMTRATRVRQSLLPSTELPAHTHTCLTTLVLGICRVSILQRHLMGCGSQCTRTHAHFWHLHG